MLRVRATAPYTAVRTPPLPRYLGQAHMSGAVSVNYVGHFFTQSHERVVMDRVRLV